jgi:hypothetical protein
MCSSKAAKHRVCVRDEVPPHTISIFYMSSYYYNMSTYYYVYMSSYYYIYYNMSSYYYI